MNEKHDEIVNIINEYVREYDEYADYWQEKAWKCHLLDQGEIDWSHKKPDQAKIHLNKLGLARAQVKAGVKKGLMKWDDWLKVEGVPNMESELLTPYEAKRMLELLFRDEDLKVKIADNYGDGFYENLIVSKLKVYLKEITGPGGKKYKTPRAELVRRDIWTYGLDPDTPEIEKKIGLYEFDQAHIRKHELLKMCHDKKSEYSPSKPYIKSQVKLLEGGLPLNEDNQEEYDEVLGNVEKKAPINRKKKIKVTEFYGTVLDDNGEVMEYKRDRDGRTILLENVRITVGDEKLIIEEPTMFSELFWDNESPFLRHRLHRSKQHILGKAPGHPGYEIARILNEMASASADAGMKAANQLIGIVVDALENPEDVAEGISYDTVLKFTEGTNIRDAVVSLNQGTLPSEFFSVQGVLESGFTENVARNKLGLAGDLPSKQVKATELVQSTQIVQGLEDSDLMDFEDIYLERLILKAFRLALQYAKYFNDMDLEYIFKSRGTDMEEAISNFKKKAKKGREFYEELAYSFRFRGRGLKGIMSSMRKGQAMAQVFAVIGSNPDLKDLFEREGYNMTKIFEDWLKSMEVDPEEIKDLNTAVFSRAMQQARAFGEGMASARGQQASQGGGVPSAGAPAQNTPMPGNDGNF